MDELSPLIAVIEDEEHLAQGLLFNLKAEGYTTHHEAEGNAALAWLLSVTDAASETFAPPAAILLDVMLPGRDGFSIVKALRKANRYTPVLLLTARGRSEDIVEGFEAGADDYLAKPFDLNILFARLSSLLRRMAWQGNASSEKPSSPTESLSSFAEGGESASPPEASVVHLNNRTIELDALQIVTPEKTIRLTLMEADLLRYLLDNPDRIIPRKELLGNVWHVKEDTDTRAIDNFIVRLRRYLETDPAKPIHLVTVRGIGYRFVPADACLAQHSALSPIRGRLRILK